MKLKRSWLEGDGGMRWWAGGLALTGSALLLASLGWFHPVLPVVIGVGVVAGMRGAWFGAGEAGVGWPVWILAAVGGSWALAMGPPGEPVWGIWDPVVYVQAAHGMVEQGSLFMRFPELGGLPEGLRGKVSFDGGGWVDAFPGFRSVGDGVFAPMFFHAYPALMAVAGGLFGTWGMLYVNGVLFVLSGLLLFAGCRMWMSAGWAAMAAVALWLNPVMIWQSKFATAELLTQVLLLGGFVGLGRLWRDPGRAVYGALAGCSLGLAWLTRFDVVLVLAPLVILMLVDLREKERRKGLLVFMGVLGVMAGWGLAHMTWVAPHYRPWADLTSRGAMWWLAGLGVMGVLCGAPDRWWFFVRGKWPVWSRRGGMVVLAVGVVVAWMIRPRLQFDGQIREVMFGVFPWLEGTRFWLILSGRDAWNWKLFEEMFGAAGLLVGVVGLLGMGWVRLDRPVRRWWVIGVMIFGLFSVTMFHERAMPWMSRRLVPVVIPLLTVGLMVGLRGLFSLRPIWVGRVVGATVAVGVLLGAATPLRTAMAERDYPGAVAFFEAFDEALPAEAWVVVDYPGVGAALRFLRGRVAFQWDGWRAGSWDDLLKAVEEAAEEVPMLHFATLSPLNEIKPHWMEVGRVPIDTRLTVQDPRQWRRASRALKSTLYVYQVGPSERELR